MAENNQMVLSSFALFLFAVVLVIFAYGDVRRRYRGAEKRLRLQAEKRNGVVKKILGKPYLSFLDGGRLVYVHVASTSPFSRSSVFSQWTWVGSTMDSLGDVSVHVGPRIRIFNMKLTWGREIKIEGPVFEDMFVARGNSEIFIREFLTKEVRDLFFHLKRHNPVLEMIGNNFSLLIPYIPNNDHLYDQLIDAGLTMIRRARELRV